MDKWCERSKLNKRRNFYLVSPTRLHFLTSKQSIGQLHIEYKKILAGSFDPLINHIYFIQKDKSEVVEVKYR